MSDITIVLIYSGITGLHGNKFNSASINKLFHMKAELL